MLESIGPELWIQTSTTKHVTKTFSNQPMKTFTRTILMRRIRSSGFNGVPSILEKGNNFCTSSQFSSQIKSNIFISSSIGQTVASQPSVEKFDRRSLGLKDSSMKHPTEMIHY